MICTFFGHRNTPYKIKDNIRFEITQLIEFQNIKKFYVGNNGTFDLLVQTILHDLSAIYKDIRYYIVLSHINEVAISGNQAMTIFPEGLESVPAKFAICKRNSWLVKQSSIAICYVTNNFSNCHKWMEKASKKGLRIINIADVTK